VKHPGTGTERVRSTGRIKGGKRNISN